MEGDSCHNSSCHGCVVVAPTTSSGSRCRRCTWIRRARVSSWVRRRSPGTLDVVAAKQTRGYVLKFKTRLPRRPQEYAEPRSTPNFECRRTWIRRYDDDIEEGSWMSSAHPRRHPSSTNPCTTTTSRPS